MKYTNCQLRPLHYTFLSCTTWVCLVLLFALGPFLPVTLLSWLDITHGAVHSLFNALLCKPRPQIVAECSDIAKSSRLIVYHS